MKAKSFKAKTPEEIRDFFDNNANLDFEPTFAFVFSDIQHDRDAIKSIFNERDIVIYGATTAGEFVDSSDQMGGIAILLLDMPGSAYALLTEDYLRKDESESIKQLTLRAKEQISDPVFIVSGSGFAVDGEVILRSIESAVGRKADVYGGMAGDSLIMDKPAVYSNSWESMQGVILLAIDSEKYDITGRATCGYKPCGTVKTITRSKGWWVHEIDGIPAMEVIVKYMGLDINQKEVVDDVAVEVGTNFPIQIQREKGEPFMRVITKFNWDDRSVMVNGSISEGTKIRLSLPADFEVIDEVIKDCKKVKSEELNQADAIIIFECAGRLTAFGPLVGKEIQGIKETYKAPMAGFFTYGEFGRTINGDHQYHNLTCSWVAIREKLNTVLN